MTSTRVTRLPREERRAQLLDAAGQVFTEKGYHAAAMDDIAETAGVSKPVLYQHFDSKLELYLALLDASCEKLTALIAEALDSTDDNAERVRATTNAFYDFVSRSGRESAFVFESDLTAEPEVERRIWRLNNDIADAVAKVIAEDTGLPPAKAKLLAISLVGSAQVSARYWMSTLSDFGPESGPEAGAGAEPEAGAGAEPESGADGRSAVLIDVHEAEQLISNLQWRGISGFPRTDHPH